MKKFVIIGLAIILFLGIDYLLFGIVVKKKINTTTHQTKMVGLSMLPTLQDQGPLLINTSFDKSRLKNGDLVVFEIKTDTQKYNTVKRVIGIGGDNLKLVKGDLYLNDDKLSEPYLFEQSKTYADTYLPDGKEIRVPSDSVFVLGDNRVHSYDSRIVGPIKLSDLVGLVTK